MVAKNFTPTKGQIHNTTGTICKASKQACPLDGGHSVDVESFIEKVSESHGYDASVMRKYAAEGLPPEDILILTKENAQTVGTIEINQSNKFAGNRRFNSRKIDKREARKRWNRGLSLAMAQDRTFFNHSQPLLSSNYVTKEDLVKNYGSEWEDFDYAVSQSANNRNGSISFAAPELEKGYSKTSRDKTPIEDIKVGDKIDVSAVGNWKVVSRVDNDQGETLLKMGDENGPTLRISQKEDNFSAELLDGDGIAYSDVSDSVTSGTIVRNNYDTNPNAVRESIFNDYPDAIFTETGEYGFVDGSIVRFRGINDPMRQEAVATWDPNTSVASMFRRR